MISATGTDGLSEDNFSAIAALALAESGLQLAPEKKVMIQSRLRKRLKVLKLGSFDEYCRFVTGEDGIGERRHLISALTTNVSHFFREKHHYDLLVEKVLPDALKRLSAGGRFRIWSAGSSNGQEAVSIAMSLLEAEPRLAQMDLRILGTDIDPEVVAFSQGGSYPARMIDAVPERQRQRYFEEVSGPFGPCFRTTGAIREMIRFRELNLLGPWPMKGVFDVIFCRNVAIYFSPETQMELWPRFRQSLTPEGWLLLGHSERIPKHSDLGFSLNAPTSYRRINN